MAVPCGCTIITSTDLGQPLEKVISPGKKKIGVIVGSIFGVAAVGLCAVSFPFILPAFRRICLPYVPATDVQIRNVMQLLESRKGSVVDLGSGDGRIVIEAAKRGFFATGIELNVWLVLYSKIQAYFHGVRRKTCFYKEDIWKTHITNYENVIVFGVEEMMPVLEKKIEQEVAKGTCIIACRFPLPNWRAVKTTGSGMDTVWMYEK